MPGATRIAVGRCTSCGATSCGVSRGSRRLQASVAAPRRAARVEVLYCIALLCVYTRVGPKIYSCESLFKRDKIR